MRALICSPGTAFVIGVRCGAVGEIRLRSVIGVNAPGGSPVTELLSGVVFWSIVVLLVVRSLLTKQLISARSLPMALRTSSHVVAARAVNETISNSAAAPQVRRNMFSPPLVIPASRMHVSLRLGNSYRAAV